MVYAFKDGSDSLKFARIFASAIYNQLGPGFMTNKVVLIVPASNKQRTIQRFRSFCDEFATLTGASNGFHLLTNNGYDRVPANQGGDRNASLENYLSISSNFGGKNLVIIDDVRTSGSSSNQIYSLLQGRNVGSITFLYLARTVGFT